VDQSFAGTVTRVSPAVDAQSRTFLIEITVPNPQRLLKPGSFASIQIDVGQEPVLAIPEPALVVFAGVNKVFVVVGNKLAERRVDLGDRTEGWIEVRSGLRDEELVVVNPTGSMIVGMPVTVTETK
jgi:RND family efflux transporter MFP subunit